MSKTQATVLILDEEPSSRLILTRALSKAGFMPLTVDSAAQLRRVAERESPDLIVMDLDVLDGTGTTFCSELTQHPGTADTPVIFLTQESDPGSIAKVFANGGCDYITKPLIVDELLARVGMHVRLCRAEQQQRARNGDSAVTDDAAQQNDSAASGVDPITGLLTKSHWQRFAEQEVNRCNRERESFCVLLVNIDRFSVLNTAHGREAGDDCLLRVAKSLSDSCRPFDLVGRSSGGELIILATNSGWVGGNSLGERIRRAIHTLRIPHPEEDFVTVSIGVAEWRSEPLADVIIRADHALYAAKRSGCDCVCVVDCDNQPAMRLGRRKSLSEGLASTVLVVDDDPTGRALCKRYLERENYRVCEAEDGLEALKLISETPPAVVIMDVMMPHMDGLEATRRLKANTATSEIPIIMTSALSEAKDITTGLEAGADEYLTKPLRGAELALRVGSMIRLRQKCEHLQLSIDNGKEQNRILHFILEYCRGVGTVSSIQAIYESTVAVASKVARSRRVSIMVVNGDHTALRVVHAQGISPDVIETTTVPLDDGIAGRVFSTGQSVVINTEEDALKANHRYEAPYFASLPLFALPLGNSNNVMGVLNITERWDEGTFEPQELEYLELIASIAGTMLSNLSSRAGRDQARDSIMVALANLAEHRDSDTGQHVDRVTKYCQMLAEELQHNPNMRAQVTPKFVTDLERAAPLHDIGKVAIPDSVLLKPGRLTPSERAIMEEHTSIGLETIRSVIERTPGTSFLEMAADITHFHHEWYNGSGYPGGISAQDIPLAARITALADVYDALTTERVYKTAFSHHKAVTIITESSGTQFDPAIVDAFIAREQDFARLAEELRDNSSTKDHDARQMKSPARGC